MQFDLDRALDDARKLRNDPDKLLEACDWLLQLDDLGHARCAELHGLKGYALRVMGLLKDAESEFVYATQLALCASNDELVASSYLHLATIKIESHLFDEARTCLMIARHRYILCCSLEGEARVLFSLANILILEKRFSEARLALDDAMVNYNEIDHVEGMSQVIATSALINIEEGNFENAIEKLNECDRLFLALDCRKNVLANQLNLAYCYEQLGNLSYAKVLVSSAKEMARAQGYHIIEARALIILSNIGQLEGDTDEAARLFYEARELSLKWGFRQMFEAIVQDLQLDKRGSNDGQ